MKFRCTFLLLMILNHLVLNATSNMPNLDWAADVGAKSVPSRTRLYNVLNFGAIADGVTMNTKAIQNAIDECASKGGGIVTFSPGRYLTGAIYLKEGVHFILPKGVMLLGSTDIKDYPDMDTRIAGIEMVWPSALINVLSQKNVKLSGEGIVHGQGKKFWDSYWNLRKEYETKGLRWIVDYDSKRPRTLLVSESSDVTIEDLTFQQAGFWTIQILYSSYCTVNGIVIQNNIDGHGPSTDGVDIDSSSRILVENCDIDCNDDNFCLKSGRDADGLRVNKPTEYIVIRNCVSRAGSGLLTCGSETSGGIRYVLADGLKAKGTKVGIRLKSAMNRGGTTEHIYVKNVEMDDVKTVFEATMNWNPSYSYSKLPKEYEGKTLPDHWIKMLEEVPVSKGTPYFNDVYLSDFKISNSNTFMSVSGSEQSMMKNFSFNNIDADVEKIGSINYAQNWEFSDIQIKAKEQNSLQITNSQQIPFPNQSEFENITFSKRLKTKNSFSIIESAQHPEFAFLLPEMSGSLKFGIIKGNDSKWLQDIHFKDSDQKDSNHISYVLSDPILENGRLKFNAVSLDNTDGFILEVVAENIPSDIQLLWSYGGALGKVLGKKDTKDLNPFYCKNNVFSVEHTAFTLYYGESMDLKTIHGITPVKSEICLSNTQVMKSPIDYFYSGKTTNFPALTGKFLLKNNTKEYFCIYKQNAEADYNYFMLPMLFRKNT